MQVRRWLELALGSVEREIEVIDDLKHLLELEANKVEAQRVRVNVVDCARAALSRAALELSYKGLNLIEDLPTPTICIKGDPTLLTLSITNLLDNAIKFTARGQVRLSCAQKVNGCASRLMTLELVSLTTNSLISSIRSFRRGTLKGDDFQEWESGCTWLASGSRCLVEQSMHRVLKARVPAFDFLCPSPKRRTRGNNPDVSLHLDDRRHS